MLAPNRIKYRFNSISFLSDDLSLDTFVLCIHMIFDQSMLTSFLRLIIS